MLWDDSLNLKSKVYLISQSRGTESGGPKPLRHSILVDSAKKQFCERKFGDKYILIQFSLLSIAE